jgi:hypothetical protein
MPPEEKKTERIGSKTNKAETAIISKTGMVG